MKREVSPDYSLLAHTYRPAAARCHTIIAVYALAAILVCMFVLMLWLPQLPWSIAPAAFKLYAITIACPIARWTAMLFIDRISVCLLISPEGITYSGLSYCISAPWENVAEAGQRTVRTRLRLRSMVQYQARLGHPGSQLRPYRRAVTCA